MSRRQAIIGVGQTVYQRRNPGSNGAELVRHAVQEALRDAGIGLDAIGLVSSGVAPDALAGIADIDKASIARPSIPYFRVNTGGASGSSAFLAAMTWIAAGRCDAALVVGMERMGHAATAQKVFNSIFDPIYEKDISLSTISMVAMRATMLMQEHGYTVDHWAGLAARNSASSMLNDTIARPRSFTAADVLASPVLAWPIHALESCPMTEGACAVVLVADHLVGDRKAAWVQGAAGLSDSYAMGDRIRRKEGSLVELLTLIRAGKKAYDMAGIEDPGAQVDCVEIQAPFASSEVMAYTALGLCAPENGVAFVDEQIDGRSRISINPSGGPQAVNPVSATALIRIAEAALQVRGMAGRRQRDGIRRAVATGQGGATQFSTSIVLGDRAQ
jgi:acetyl-CoA C-acetyltransferase